MKRALRYIREEHLNFPNPEFSSIKRNRAGVASGGEGVNDVNKRKASEWGPVIT